MSNAVPGGPNLRGAVDLSSLVRPPASSGPAPTGITFAANDANFTQVLDLSSRVPVIVEFHGQGVEPALQSLVESYGGRIALAQVDGPSNPQLVQAFQVTQVPTVAAVIAGRPVQLFAGMPPEEELRGVLEQVLQLASQQGVTGSIQPPEIGEDGEPVPVEEPLPPHHQEAYDAIAAGDFAAAIKEYESAIKENPRDALAVAGLAQVSLLARLGGASADDIRATGAANPTDVDAQLAVADLDVSGGHLEDAFARLLDLFPSLDPEGKNRVRTRLLEYFEITGPDDPRVADARRRLTVLLY
jgi:putative thioredoxin